MKVKVPFAYAGVMCGAIISIYLAFTFAPIREHSITGISEVYFNSRTACTVYSLNPDTKEYKVQKIYSHYGPIRIFLDRGIDKGPNEVKWKSTLDNYDVEVHVADLKLIRGNIDE